LRFRFSVRDRKHTCFCRCFIHPCSAHFFVYSVVKVQGQEEIALSHKKGSGSSLRSDCSPLSEEIFLFVCPVG
jgi:hypothetical protein